jgi:hypothetical protein
VVVKITRSLPAVKHLEVGPDTFYVRSEASDVKKESRPEARRVVGVRSNVMQCDYTADRTAEVTDYRRRMMDDRPPTTDYRLQTRSQITDHRSQLTVEYGTVAGTWMESTPLFDLLLSSSRHCPRRDIGHTINVPPGRRGKGGEGKKGEEGTWLVNAEERWHW